MIHLAFEAIRRGPQGYYAQWTMERMIGLLGAEICQPSNPYANLSIRALLLAQVNALYAMAPHLDRKSRKAETLPRYAVDCGAGYVLLRRRDRRPITVQNKVYARAMRKQLDLPRGAIELKRWARVRLPNGQIARSVFAEEHISRRNIRVARMVKVEWEDDEGQTVTKIVEIDYYFQAKGTAFGVGNMWSDPDPELLRDSYGTVWSSSGSGGVLVFEIHYIKAVVAMVPWLVNGREESFLVEKPGLDIVTLSGYEEEDLEAEEQ
uniref:Uncharacterized protein n=1 Tax=Mycena chlorophos TaxID=658473 RepID=A0ABQ0LEJ2_MYCCL|nr:predicted protein [Mycena chlorophos]